MGTMHAGRIETSKRMQELLALLTERGATGATSLEITQRTGALNPPTEVSALRKRLRERDGMDILCSFDRVTENGSRVYRYRLVPKPDAPAGELFA